VESHIDVAFAQIRLYAPEGWDEDGNLFVDPEHLKWQTCPVVPSSVCNHEEMICGECIESWECDWEIELDDEAEMMLVRVV